MTPWFSAGSAKSLLYLSLFSLVAVLQIFVDRGRYRAMVTAVLAVGTGLGATLLILAATAGVAGQPGYVVFVLGLAGVVISVVLASILLSLPGQARRRSFGRTTPNDM